MNSTPINCRGLPSNIYGWPALVPHHKVFHESIFRWIMIRVPVSSHAFPHIHSAIGGDRDGVLCLQTKLASHQLICNIETTSTIYDNTTNSNMTVGAKHILMLLFILVITSLAWSAHRITMVCPTIACSVSLASKVVPLELESFSSSEAICPEAKYLKHLISLFLWVWVEDIPLSNWVLVTDFCSLALKDVSSFGFGVEFRLFFYEEIEPFSCVHDLPLFFSYLLTFHSHVNYIFNLTIMS